MTADSDWHNRVTFILVEPSHPGNIGASARAVNTMGFRDLRVVRPVVKTYRTDEEALALATNSADILQKSRSYETLGDALYDVSFAWAVSGYDREYGAPIRDMQSAGDEMLSQLKAFDGKIAFVFGCERCGLGNEDFVMCQGVAAIPASEESKSLNLSQAVQVCAYEMHMHLMHAREPAKPLYDWETRFGGEKLASPEATEAFMRHLEEAMVFLGCINPEEPKRFMPRMRRLFHRTDLTVSEINMLRGVCAQILRPKKDRAGTKKPSTKSSES